MQRQRYRPEYSPRPWNRTPSLPGIANPSTNATSARRHRSPHGLTASSPTTQRQHSPCVIIFIILCALVICAFLSRWRSLAHIPVVQSPQHHASTQAEQQNIQHGGSPLPPATTNTWFPARRRACAVLRRLQTSQSHESHSSSSSTSSSANLRPELFEHLGLDPAAPPFYPASEMAFEGRPRYRECRQAIQEAWLSRLGEAGVGTKGKEQEVSELREALAGGGSGDDDDGNHNRQSGGGGDQVGLLHSVAGVLWDDETRREYVDYILPVLRPTLASRLTFWNVPEKQLGIACPPDAELL